MPTIPQIKILIVLKPVAAILPGSSQEPPRNATARRCTMSFSGPAVPRYFFCSAFWAQSSLGRSFIRFTFELQRIQILWISFGKTRDEKHFGNRSGSLIRCCGLSGSVKERKGDFKWKRNKDKSKSNCNKKPWPSRNTGRTGRPAAGRDSAGRWGAEARRPHQALDERQTPRTRDESLAKCSSALILACTFKSSIAFHNSGTLTCK